MNHTYVLPATNLLMSVLTDIPAVDEQHLVSLIKAWNGQVSWGVWGHAGHDDGHTLVCSPLDAQTWQKYLLTSLLAINNKNNFFFP